jgi:chemotaxis protein CheX
VTTLDTGLRRRSNDARRAITELIDEATVQSIAEEAWTALVGEDEVLVPLPAELPGDVLSSWVDLTGPWTGSVVVTTGRSTAEELARCMLKEHAPPLIDVEDIADALGEIANVVGGNIKAVLPPPSALSLPKVGTAAAPPDPTDVARIDVLWRGEPLSISVQGALPPLPVPSPARENEVPQ